MNAIRLLIDSSKLSDKKLRSLIKKELTENEISRIAFGAEPLLLGHDKSLGHDEKTCLHCKRIREQSIAWGRVRDICSEIWEKEIRTKGTDDGIWAQAEEQLLSV